MAAWVEVTTNVLDIASFVLVTPLVVGTDKLTDLLTQLERANIWVHERFFAPGANGLSLSNYCSMLSVFAFVVALLADLIPFRVGTLVTGGAIGMAVWILPPSVADRIVQLHGFVAWLSKRYGRDRTLALLGAVAFMAARILAITSAVTGG